MYSFEPEIESYRYFGPKVSLCYFIYIHLMKYGSCSATGIVRDNLRNIRTCPIVFRRQVISNRIISVWRNDKISNLFLCFLQHMQHNRG